MMATFTYEPATEIVNASAVAHFSPFRYPGGKAWLVPRIYQWLRHVGPVSELAEPFAGGAIVGLSAMFRGCANRIALVEKDWDVAAVWTAILGPNCRELVHQILNFEMTLDNAKAVLERTPANDLERAFGTIVRNRVQRGGILAPGATLLKKGENGKGVKSRWYPETLKRRIEAIHQYRNQIDIIRGDGIDFIRYNSHRKDTVFFIDPPYTAAGRRLYTHSEIDHAKLFRTVKTVKGDFLMTYDDAVEIRELAARHEFDTELVAMRNTHHNVRNELLIARDLSWVRSEPDPVQISL